MRTAAVRIHSFVTFFRRTGRLKINLPGLALVIVLGCLLSDACSGIQYPTIDAIFGRLEHRREMKSEVLEEFFALRRAHVQKVAQDREIFAGLDELGRAWHDHGPYSSEYRVVEKRYSDTFGRIVSRHGYYDLFLIETDGQIVYTLKKEEDFGARVMSTQYHDLPISKCFGSISNGLAFSDYTYYPPSGEPAMFMGAPLFDADGRFSGGLVLQISIKDINAIMINRTGLGETEEQYIVRGDKVILTESRFVENSILRQVIDTTASEKALKGMKGGEIIKDYRGVNVLSAYCRFDYGSVSWAVIVEVDLDEAVRRCTDAERDRLITTVVKEIDGALGDAEISTDILDRRKNPSTVARFFDYKDEKFIKVGMGEYRVNDSGRVLYTLGVATCTAVTISSKHFGLLGHISPMDISYGFGEMTRHVLGGRVTDLVTDMMDEIRRRPDFDAGQVRELIVGIFAVSDKSFPLLIESFLRQGIGLEQIRLVYNSLPSSVNLVFDYQNESAYSQWRMPDNPVSDGSDKFFNIYGVVKPVSELAAEILSS